MQKNHFENASLPSHVGRRVCKIMKDLGSLLLPPQRSEPPSSRLQEVVHPSNSPPAPESISAPTGDAGITPEIAPFNQEQPATWSSRLIEKFVYTLPPTLLVIIMIDRFA